MTKRVLFSAVFVAALATVTAVIAQPSPAPGYGCPGMTASGVMGPGMMGRYGMGPGMMGRRGAQANLNLSVNDVKADIDRWLSMSRNPHVKLGSVTQKDEHTIVAEILTTDKDALVQRFAVDRSTGVYRSE